MGWPESGGGTARASDHCGGREKQIEGTKTLHRKKRHDNWEGEKIKKKKGNHDKKVDGQNKKTEDAGKKRR